MPQPTTLVGLRAAIGRDARRCKRFPDDQLAAQRLKEARREYAEALIADHVATVMATAPPLTDEQRHRLARLFCVNQTSI